MPQLKRVERAEQALAVGGCLRERKDRQTISAGQWLTARDIADRLQISRSAAFALVRKVPRLKMGRITRVSEEVFAAYLAANMVGPFEHGPLERERQRHASAVALAWQARKWGKQGASSERPAPAPIRHTRQPPTVPLLEAPQVRPTRPRRSGPITPSKNEPSRRG